MRLAFEKSGAYGVRTVVTKATSLVRTKKLGIFQKSLELLFENLVTFKDTGFILPLAFEASTVAFEHSGASGVRTAMVHDQAPYHLLRTLKRNPIINKMG